MLPSLSPPAVGESISLLPVRPRLFGPVTSGKLARLLRWYLACLVLGWVLSRTAQNDALQIFGLGMMWPGAGFVAQADICTTRGFGHVAMAMGALGLFALSLLIWFGTGNILAPPLAWLGTAWWSASMAHGPVQPDAALAVGSVLALACGAWLVWTWGRLMWSRRQRVLDNAYLSAHADSLATIFTAPVWQPADDEMSLTHLQRLRFALDRALQPLDKFDGFEARDQFQTAALRYQINFLAYGIALTQARYTPAFEGYMHEAQHKLLAKQTQHRVWAYWALENLWGNLSWQADPVACENIMFTGFVALQMGLYQASTGVTACLVPGSFRLQHPAGPCYAYDLPSLLKQLDKAYQSSDFCLIACEPNWVYPLCNTMGACAILAHDAQQGQANWRQHASRFRQHLEAEFLDGFGRYVPCRSAHTGLALPAVGGAMPQAMPCYFLNVLEPDVARRQWLLLRRGLFNQRGHFSRRAFWRIDTGNYGLSRASAYTATALAAAELGDEEVYTHCMAALEDECPSVLKAGVVHRSKASVWAHGVELMARANGRDGLRQLITRPLVDQGPRLGKVSYPDVLVARAHADARSGALEAVLYPGAEDGVYAMALIKLQPHGFYRISGALVRAFQADGEGRACLDVALSGRTCLRVEPLRCQP